MERRVYECAVIAGKQLRRVCCLFNWHGELSFATRQVREEAIGPYRHISTGAWPFSTRDHGWPISDCTSEGVKVQPLASSVLAPDEPIACELACSHEGTCAVASDACQPRDV